MEDLTQQRLARKIDLIRTLSLTKPHPSPKASLEQYTLPPDIAATIGYVAAYTFGDIIGKTVLDLGCGTGRLALAASFLGARQTVGIDIDKIAIRIASENFTETGLKNPVDWVLGDINAIKGSFDTILQNPPFGVQKRAADRKFLEKALEVAHTTYSLHNHPYNDPDLANRLKSVKGRFIQVSPTPFIQKLVEANNGVIKAVYAILMSIPHMFDFHRKRKLEFVADLYLIKKSDG